MRRGLRLTHLQLASNPPESGIPSRAEVTTVKLLSKNNEKRLSTVDSCIEDSCIEKTLPKLPCCFQNPQMSLGIASGRPRPPTNLYTGHSLTATSVHTPATAASTAALGMASLGFEFASLKPPHFTETTVP